MSRSRHSPQRSAPLDAKPASQARRQFAPLAEKLQAARSVTATWDSAHEEAERLAKAGLVPLSASVDERMKQLLLVLDREHGSEALDEDERDTLSRFILTGRSRCWMKRTIPSLKHCATVTPANSRLTTTTMPMRTMRTMAPTGDCGRR